MKTKREAILNQRPDAMAERDAKQRRDAERVLQDLSPVLEADYARGKPIAEGLMRKGAALLRALMPQISAYVRASTRLSLLEVAQMAADGGDLAVMAERAAGLSAVLESQDAWMRSRRQVTEMSSYLGALFATEPDAVIIAPERALVDALVATDFASVSLSELRWPVPRALVLRVPAGLLQSYDQTTGWHDIEVITAMPAVREPGLGDGWSGEGLSCTYRGGPNANCKSYEDDHYRVDFVPMRTEGSTSPELMSELLPRVREGQAIDRMRSVRTRVRDGEQWVDAPQGCENLLIGALLYLTLPSASVTRPANGKAVPITELREAPATRVRVSGAEPATKWLTYALGVGDRGPRIGYKHLVRGHWKQQAHGPRNQLRKITWIRPYVRHPDGPGEVGAREYTVKK